MVKTIRYKGVDYPIRIGYKALKAANRELGRDYRGDGQSFDYEGAESLLYHGLRSGAEYEGKELSLEKKQMEDLLDDKECMSQFLGSFEAFSQPPSQGA